MLIIHFGHTSGAATDATCALGEGAVDGIIDIGLETPADGVAFGPDNDVRAGLVELFWRIGDPGDVEVGVVVDVGRLITAVRAIIVCRSRTVVDRAGPADGANIRLRAG